LILNSCVDTFIEKHSYITFRIHIFDLKMANSVIVDICKKYIDVYGSKFDDYYKILLIGDLCTGKSSFITNFTTQTTKEKIYTKTVGIASDFQRVQINDKSSLTGAKNIKLALFDTSGDEKFHDFNKYHYSNSNAIVICFSLIDKKTFENLEYWFKHINFLAHSDTKIVLIATHADRTSERVVTKTEAEKFAYDKNVMYFEVSNNNIDKINKTMTFVTKQVHYQKLLNDSNSQKHTEILIMNDSLTPYKSENAITESNISKKYRNCCECAIL